ncbi:ricin-type beta-trefoil lectin domain protein [Kitasatospora sp. NPDC058965]|uniref:ricin-type beta-trefoil lectin domain protein n=1 Tax=Kitasatospora sp. NPDC058965 TaxID=3346682 RepID=UPI00369A7CE8
MSIWTALEPASTTVDPGSNAAVTLRLRNTGDLVEEYRIEVVGDCAPWVVVEPATLKLLPQGSGSVRLTFTVPRGPEAAAGPHPFGVRVTPSEQPEAAQVPEGVLTVTPFTALVGELVPPVTRGRLRGRARLAVDNVGNVPATVSLLGRESGTQLGCDIRPSSVRIEPGRAVFAEVRVRPEQVLWTGRKERHGYGVLLQRSGAAPQPVEGTYLQSAVLPGWATKAGLVALALGTACVALWLTTDPSVSSRAHDLALAAAPVAGGAPSPVPLAPTPAPSAAPASPGQPQAPAAQPGSGQTSAAPAAQQPAQPAQTKAAQPQQPAPQQPAPQPAPQKPAPQQPAPAPAGMKSGRIRNTGDGLIVDIYSGTTTNGTGLTVIDYRPANTGQGWNQPHNGSDSTFLRFENQLEPSGSVVVMDEDQASHRVQLWAWGGGQNQEWWLDSTTTPGSSYIHNRATGDCLTDNGSGQQVTAVTCRTGDPAQLWTFS